MVEKKKGDTPPKAGRDEMNLVEFPFATVHPNDKRKAIIYERWITENGKRQRLKWTVSTTVLAHLPSEFGVRIFLALLKLADEQHWPEQINFTLYRVLQMLGLPTTKQYYESAKQELINLKSVVITSENAFWDHSRKKRVNLRGFNLLDDLQLIYSVDGQEYAESEGTNYVVFGEQVLKSIQSGYLKRLDLGYYLSLTRPLSRQLYRFLDKRLRYQDGCEVDVFDLANRLGMARYKYPSQVMQKLQPAIDELVEREFLLSGEAVKRGKYTRVKFIRSIEGKNEIVENEAWPELPVDDDYQNSIWAELQRQHGTDEAEIELEIAFHNSIRHAVGEPTYTNYLAGVVVLSCKESEVVLGTPNTYCRDFLQARLLDKLVSFFNQHSDKAVTTISFELPSSLNREVSEQENMSTSA